MLERFAKAPTDFWGRLEIWNDAWRIFLAFPWLGTGLNTFGTATTLYQSSQFESHHVEAHNDYVQLLSEGGLALALLAAAAIFILGREIRRRFRENADDTVGYWTRVGATTGLVAIALQDIVEFSLQIPGIAALFAVAAAIAIRPAGDHPTDPPSSLRDPSTALRIAPSSVEGRLRRDRQLRLTCIKSFSPSISLDTPLQTWRILPNRLVSVPPSALPAALT